MRRSMLLAMLVPAFWTLACTHDMKNPLAPSVPTSEDSIADSVVVSAVDSSAAQFSWHTRQLSDSRIICVRLTDNYTDTTYSSLLTEYHLLWVIGRRDGTSYECKVESRDGSGRIILSRRSRFTTMNVTPFPPLQPPVVLAIPTYDGSGQTVHPGLDDCSFWLGHLCRLVIEPYPNGNDFYENASLYVSDDYIHWAPPDGVTNPIIPRIYNGYNSDADNMHDPIRNREVVIWRVVDGENNTILASTSPDLVHWDSATEIYQTPNHGAVSPTIAMFPDSAGVVRTARWDVVVDSRGCGADSSHVVMSIQKSDSGFDPKAAWSDTVTTDLHQPGYVIWHIVNRYLPSLHKFLAFFAAFPKPGANGYPPYHSCGENDEFAALSQDGIHWTTYRLPFMKRNVYDWARQSLYRFGFAYDSLTDKLHVLLSGFSIVTTSGAAVKVKPGQAVLMAAVDGPKVVNGLQMVWTTAYAEWKLSDLLAYLEQGGRNP